MIRSDVPLVRSARGTSVHAASCKQAARIKTPVSVQPDERGYLGDVRFPRDDPRWPHHLFYAECCWLLTHDE